MVAQNEPCSARQIHMRRLLVRIQGPSGYTTERTCPCSGLTEAGADHSVRTWLGVHCMSLCLSHSEHKEININNKTVISTQKERYPMV